MSTLALDASRWAEGTTLAARRMDDAHAAALQEHERRALEYQQWETLGIVAPRTVSGVSITQMTAFEIAAWWCGINVVAGDVGVLDFDLYRRTGDDDREKVSGHPVARVLAEPNEYMTPMIFWQTLMAHALGWGNAYAEIEFDNAMRPIALWPIPPHEIEPVVTVKVTNQGRRESTLWYRYLGQYRLEAEDVLHIPGLGFDGIRGYSVVALARQSLGLSVALERFGSALFGNGTWPGMVLQHPGQLSTPALERLKASVQSMHRGSENAFKLLVAEEGMTVSKPVTVNPNDAQAVQTREHQIAEVARWLNLPPHKLKHKMGERPGGNLESSETDYHITTLLPWTTRIAQICNRKLISPGQRSSYYTEHTYSRRLQPTPKERSEIQKTYFEMRDDQGRRVLDVEQIARQENLPKPKTPPKADPPPAPATPPQDQPPPDPPPAAPQADRAVAVVRARTALDKIVRRYHRREAENMLRAARRGMPHFGERVEEFYGEGERGVLADSLEDALALSAGWLGSMVDARAVAEGFAQAYLVRSKDELLAIRAKEVDRDVAALLKRWEAVRPIEGVQELMAALGAEEEKHVA